MNKLKRKRFTKKRQFFKSFGYYLEKLGLVRKQAEIATANLVFATASNKQQTKEIYNIKIEVI
jgi:hypothetical protein